MTKQEIVDIVSDATGLTKVETETVIFPKTLSPEEPLSIQTYTLKSEFKT